MIKTRQQRRKAARESIKQTKQLNQQKQNKELMDAATQKQIDEGKRLNIYNCKDCGNTIVTIDRHLGTTPFVLQCAEYKGCKTGVMMSAMYNVPALFEPSHEWYKPDNKVVVGNNNQVTLDIRKIRRTKKKK